MKRSTLIKVHLYLSGISLFFMLLMAFSGAMHLLTGDENESVKVVKEIPIRKTYGEKKFKLLFTVELKNDFPDYKFDYIKGSSNSLVSRPTTRRYYTATQYPSIIVIREHTPSFMKRVMELHKGHGARSTRRVMGVLGFIILGAALTGLWLGISAPAFRIMTLSTVGSGLAIYLFLFFL